MQLFNSMSSPSFLLANDANHSLLRSLLDAINAIVEHQYSSESSLLVFELGLVLTVLQRTRISSFPY